MPRTIRYWNTLPSSVTTSVTDLFFTRSLLTSILLFLCPLCIHMHIYKNCYRKKNKKKTLLLYTEQPRDQHCTIRTEEYAAFGMVRIKVAIIILMLYVLHNKNIEYMHLCSETVSYKYSARIHIAECSESRGLDTRLRETIVIYSTYRDNCLSLECS